ncbi:HAD-IIB family hydrolase [Mycetocola tolaasinivorans]|uniref:HAD-IIB family hydrolase n=1 Tax=Mycetocola tolaasinivorans TaxID=76635 RepID=A0A3L7A795_9MICO|nr:HAD-IIB family hydrolase [Mycetocola tolaasinivorans]
MNETDVVSREPAASPWLVALDVDGTVAHEDGSVSPAVRDAVRAAAARGHEVMLATGRSWGATHIILSALGITPRYVVCANGAMIMRRDPESPEADAHGYVIDHVETFLPDDVLTIIRPHLSDGRYLVEYPEGFRRYTEGMYEWDLNNAEQVEFEELLGTPVIRVVVVSPEHDEAEFSQVVAEMGLHQVAYAIGWTAWMDIAPLGVNKSTALAVVRERLGIPFERVLVAGDGRNDIEMMEWARDRGRAVVMGQAPESVLAVAGEITGPVSADGLAPVLDSLP